MGLLVDGVWPISGTIPKARVDASCAKFPFRNWVTPDGAPGPTGAGGFKAEPGRYHLYVSLACPWAHRTLIFRKLKRLEPMIALSVVHWLMGENGWTFAEAPGVVPDPIHGARFLHEIYTRAVPRYTGRVTVPVLWDKATNTIANNESSEIIRMFNSAFDVCGAAPGDFCPEELREEIDGWNTRIYDTVNNGVYRAGFATSQEAYEEAFFRLFETLDMLDEHLGRHRYLTGDRLTEADWRLFTTLLRFDVVYVGHFKCNLRASPITRTYPATCAIFIRSQVWPTPSICGTSRGTTTRAIALSTRPASSPQGHSWTLLFHMGAVDQSGLAEAQ